MDYVNTVVLENGKEYTEIDSLEYMNIKYMLYANTLDARDCCIRKLVVIDSEKFLCKLDDDLEFKTIVDLFIDKNLELLS